MTIQELFAKEPRLSGAIEKALEAGRDNDNPFITYVACKRAIEPLVGWYGENPKLRKEHMYETAIEYICDRLGI